MRWTAAELWWIDVVATAIAYRRCSYYQAVRKLHSVLLRECGEYRSHEAIRSQLKKSVGREEVLG